MSELLSEGVPDQLSQYPKIALCQPDGCIVHDNCNSPGKAPISKDWQNKDESWIQVKRSIESTGGNYGVVCRPDNDLVVIDSDSNEFTSILRESLPDTFTVETANGRHFYYTCKDWSENKRWDSPKGEIKAENSQVVGPYSVHPSGQLYQLVENREMESLSVSKLESFSATLSGTDESVDCGEGSGSGSRQPSPPSPHSTNNLQFIQRDDLRKKVANILHDSDAGHSDRCWLAGWLYGAAGLSESEITSLIMKESRWGDLDRDTVDQQVSSIISSSDSTRGTHYSNYSGGDSTTDDAGNGDSSRGIPQNKSMPSETKMTANAKNVEDGIVVRAALRKIDPDSNGEEYGSWDTHSIVFGELEEDSDFGEVPTWETNKYNSTNYCDLGERTPEELRAAATALESLADEIEE